jgi:manganese/zinc/iron transport system substrate-binding protein
MLSDRVHVLGSGILILAVLAGLSGCSENRAADARQTPVALATPGQTYTIVTTCGMVTDIVRQVAGPRAKVVGLMGEGVDPHLFKPKTNEVRQLLDADVVFYSGQAGVRRDGRTIGRLSARAT